MRASLWSHAPASVCAVLLVLFAAREVAAAEDYRRGTGVLWGLDSGVAVRVAGDNNVRELPNIENMFVAGMELGYRLWDFEVTAVLRIRGDDDENSIGVDGLYRLPCTDLLLVGLGVHATVFGGNPALEFVLPRIDLRLPISRSWEFSWTVLRLSYMDQGLLPSRIDYGRDERALIIGTTIGLRARADRIWERETPPPLSPGLLIRVEHQFGLTGPVADEQYDYELAGDDSVGFPSSGLISLELTPGYRLEFDSVYLELGLPVAFHSVQLKASVGLSALWRFKRLPFLALGLSTSYLPKRFIMLQIPRLMLTYRPSEVVEIFFNPAGAILIFEPTRDDVWVEEGFESKVPYFGFFCGLGIGWTAPARASR